ncbi:PucR family transcriptional regulator [Planobispora takensis]|uniref:PucR C-terminal helix-turn-helix domain-containing protein n=1 Tax=Planobispora takensis TaxID=1367882 RepID=A0A8J3WUS3_9ACTN|nr:helix-turn-helix domain-containing protein [Planobispora takensis]GII03026.1 hypothetical protein Pta02_50340 [Planobispora takensis]
MGKAERIAVRDELAAALPEAGQALVDAVVEAIPAYRALDPGQLAEVRAIAAWALTRAVDAWAGDAALSEQDLARFRGIGAARAGDGRPLPAVLRAYRVAAGEANDLVMRQGRGRLDVEDVLALTRQWLTGLDELSEALFSGYVAAGERLAGDRERAVRDLFDDLLAGRQTSPGALADRCRNLGLALPRTPGLLLAEPLDPALSATPADASSLLDAVRSGSGGSGDPGPGGGEPRGGESAVPGPAVPGAGVPGTAEPAGLVTTRGRRAALLLPPGARAALGNAVAGRGWRGCLIEGLPLAEVPAAYRLAGDALDTAPEYAYDDTGLLGDGDAHVLALLDARPGADPAAVVGSVLGPLADPRHAHLLEGLGAFLTTGSATAAADLLHLHPQTLRYRLRRARELTGRDPRRPWQRLVLDVARHLAEIRTARR